MTFEKKPVTPSPLELLNPVPSDIDIAHAAVIKPIKDLADEIGLLDWPHLVGMVARYHLPSGGR